MDFDERVTEQDEDKSDRFIDSVLETMESMVFAVFVMLLLFSFVLKIVLVRGQSMEDSLFDGDRLIISNLFYHPQGGDVIVVNSHVLNETIVKRVIATEGQHVEIDYKSDTVMVDGEIFDNSILNDDAIDMQINLEFNAEHYNSEKDVYEYDVPNNCVFVMGDNRNHSTDSRTIGFIDNDDILGKVIFRVYSSTGKIGKVS